MQWLNQSTETALTCRRCERALQNLARRLGAVELAQRAPLDLPSLRGAHELPAVRGHAMHAEAARAAVIRHGYRIALCLRHQDLQIGRHYRRVAVDRDMRQAGE